MSGDVLSKAAAELRLMAFFPAGEDARLALMRVLARMVDNEEHLKWLVNRTLVLYSKWPGIGEIRALYCSRFPPRDGCEAFSTEYPDGYPSEKGLVTPVPAGHVATVDRDFDAALRQLVNAKDMNRRKP